MEGWEQAALLTVLFGSWLPRAAPALPAVCPFEELIVYEDKQTGGYCTNIFHLTRTVAAD